LKAVSAKSKTTLKGKPNKITADFLREILKARTA
jgi:hypothetical protein